MPEKYCNNGTNKLESNEIFLLIETEHSFIGNGVVPHLVHQARSQMMRSTVPFLNFLKP